MNHDGLAVVVEDEDRDLQQPGRGVEAEDKLALGAVVVEGDPEAVVGHSGLDVDVVDAVFSCRNRPASRDYRIRK